MITAQATITHGQVRLEVIYPDQKHHVMQRVNDIATAQQLVNFLDRQYIILKLRSWIRQRQYALPASIEAAKLVVILGTLDRQKGNSIYEFVAGNCQAFERLAPAPVSSHYPYYLDFIKPIIEYCKLDNAGSKPLKSEQ
jgi:hypothetical protein